MSVSQSAIFTKLSVGGVGTNTLTAAIIGTDGILVPAGTTVLRPTGASALAGVIRFNTTDNVLEWYDGTNWIRPSVVGGSAESDPIFSASPAGTITNTNITNWTTAYNKNVASGTFLAGTITFTRTDGSTFAVNGLPSPQVNSDWNASSGVAQILNKPTLATVATTGAYADLSGKPTIPAAQIQSDWTQTNAVSLDYIKNKPTLATVATTGNYNDLSGRPAAYTLPTASSTVLGGIKVGSGLSIDGTGTLSTNAGLGTVTSVAASITGSTALSIAGSPITTSGTLAFTWTGSSTQQVLGDGTLATKITNNNQLSNGNGYISNVTGLITAGTNITITGSGTLGSPYQIAASTGGAGLSNAYVTMTDGTNNAGAVTGDTFKFRSANNAISVLVTNNDATHGDNLLLTFNQANITIAESQVTNLTTDLAAKLSNITGLITAGANITITGSGTSGSPYQIAAAGGAAATLNQNQIGVGNASNILSGSSTFTYDGTIMQMGITTGNGTSTATPKRINMGQTYSNAAGGNLKLALFNSNTDTTPVVYGIGVSPSQMDYVISDALGAHVFYTNGSSRLTINNNGSVGVPFYNGTGTRLASFDTNGNFQRSSIDPSLVLTSITLTSDVTGVSSGSSVTTTIAANAVTYSKFQTMVASSLLGNPTGSTATSQAITLGSGLAFSGTTLVSNPPLTSTQVGFGNGSNVLSGTSTFTYSSGLLQVGTGDTANMPIPTNFYSISDISATSATTLVGASRINQTTNTTGSAQAFEGYAKSSNATGTVTLTIGTIGNVEHAGAGTNASMRGVQGGSVIRGNGTVTDSIAIIAMPTNIATGSATVTNSYGVYIGAHVPGLGTITNKYNFYASDTAGTNVLNGATKFPSLGTPTSNKLVGIATSTGEITPVTLGSTLSVSSNTVDVAAPVKTAAISTTTAASTPLITYTPVNQENGMIWVQLSAIDSTGNYLFWGFQTRYQKNSSGITSLQGTTSNVTLVSSFVSATAAINATSGNIVVSVVGQTSTTIYWNASYIITAAPYLS